MTNQQTALENAKALMQSGMSAAEANVELIRMMGVRIIGGRIDRDTRRALMDAVKAGKLGHLKKDGLKPEAFFHPNSIWNAKEERSKIFNQSVRAIQACCA